MKKRLRVTSLLLCLLLTVSTFAFTASAANAGKDSITVSYGQINKGFVDKHNVGVLDKEFKIDDKKVVKIVPLPNAEPTQQMVLESFGFDETLEINLSQYKYASLEYKYISNQPVAKKAQFSIMRTGGVLTTSFTVDADNVTKFGEWDVWYFNCSKMIDKYYNPEGDGILHQFHIRPFGTDLSGTLSADDELYLGDLTFYKTNPNPNTKATVQYGKGDPTASGSSWSAEYKLGEKYKLPECPFTLEGATFLGWKDAKGVVRKPGEELTADEDATFNAAWEKAGGDASADADTITLAFSQYHNGPVDKAKNVRLDNVTEDGFDCVKIMPVEGTGKAIRLDGFHYHSANIDLSDYHYIVFSYKYLSGDPVVDTKMRIAILRVGENGDILQKSRGFDAQSALTTGEWTTAVFDITSLKSDFIPGTDPILKQMHVAPFGEKLTADDLNPNDEMYISNIVFYKELPKENSEETHEPYMKGYEDGTFRPNGTMTRAEACTVVSRVAQPDENAIKGTADFTDVSSADWFAKYVGYCRENGWLASYSGAFLPNQNITRAELAELVYLTGLAGNGEKSVTFSDVAASHPKYSAITAAAAAGLINGYEDGTFRPDNSITRAEVATVINRALGRAITREQMSSDVQYIFLDVDPTAWYFPQVAEATLRHVATEGRWVTSLTRPEEFLPASATDLAAGKKKAEEIDALSKERIAAIRATESDLSAVKGTLFYVSADGNDDNDGTSPEKAVKTLARAAKLTSVEGDAILFRRGDTFRGTLTVRPGMTYSAYGEGPKPVLTTSPCNAADPSYWTLVEGTTNIWVFKDDLLDVGTIVFNEGEAWGYHEMPDWRGDTWTLRGSTTPFDIITALDKDLDFFTDTSKNVKPGKFPSRTRDAGPLYLRSEKGNPGECFKSIELAVGNHGVAIGNTSGVTLDNLSLKYIGGHGVSASTVKDLTVKNCEIGWIGGTAQGYSEGTVKEGTLVRYGNGVEVYGGCENFVIENCYVYQCYDAGITFQHSGNVQMNGVVYRSNVIEDCTYDIEYFNGASSDGKIGGRNILFENNILRTAGGGFGTQRYNPGKEGSINGWDSANEFENFVIKNNIFDRSIGYLVYTSASHKGYLPQFDGNTFIQTTDRISFTFSPVTAAVKYSSSVPLFVRFVLGDKNAQVYFVEE